MSNSKRLVISLSEKLYNEFNNALEEDCKKRSDFIKDAIVFYIEEKRKLNRIEEMRQGYLEMAQLNLEMSEMGFAKDINELREYEAKLSESDLSYDNSSETRRYILC